MADPADIFAHIPDAPPKAAPNDVFANTPKDPSVGDLLWQGAKKFFPGLIETDKNIIGSADPRNWPSMARNVGSLAAGAMENVRDISPPGEARGSAPPLATPRQQAAATAVGNTIVTPYKHPLQSFAVDPIGTLSAWSVPLTLGGSALESGLGATGRVAGALQTAGKVARVAGDLANPVGLQLGVAGLPGKLIPKGLSAADAAATQARFAAAGVQPSLATAGGPLTRATALFAAKGPLSLGARSNLADQVAQVGAATDKMVDSYGSPSLPGLAGEKLQAGIKNYAGDRATNTTGRFQQDMEDKYDAAFAPIQAGEDAAVAQSQQAQQAAQGAQSADHAQTLADAQDQQRGVDLAVQQGLTLPGVHDVPTPEAPAPVAAAPTTTTTSTQAQLNAIKDRINSPALRDVIQDQRVNKILDALQTDPASQRFSDLRALRTWVRSAQGNPELIQNVGKGNLQSLESALTDDIYSNAQQFGGDSALTNLQATDAAYRQGVGDIKTALQPFVDKSSSEGAFKRIQDIAGSGAAADNRSLMILKRSLTAPEFGDVRASVLQQFGQIPDGKGATTFSPSQFLKKYGEIPEASKDILFGASGSEGGAQAADSALRTQLDNLASVAGYVAPVEKSTDALKGISTRQFSGLALGMGLTALGQPHWLLGELASVVGESGVAQAMTSPRVLQWVNRVSAAAQKGGVAASNAMDALSTAAKTDAQLQPVYQAASNVLNPPKPAGKPQNGSGTPDYSKMTDEELHALAGPSGAPVTAPDTDRTAMIAGMKPEEAMALTMAGEASSDPHELAGVGHVIQNRLASGKFGSSMSDVLTPSEFNVWNNPAKLAELQGSEKYQKALEIAQQITTGKHGDITNGAQHYYAPAALASLHVSDPAHYPNAHPAFAQGDGLPLGQSVFYP